MVVREDGALLLVRRPEAGLLGGLWEPPGDYRPPGVQLVIDDSDPGPRLEPVTHAFSHKRVTYHPRIHHAVRPRLREADGIAWAVPERLDRFAVATAQRRILRLAVARLAAGRPPGG